MRLALTQTLETIRMPEHLATLLGQRGELRSELLLPCHTDRENLLGFLPRRCTA